MEQKRIFSRIGWAYFLLAAVTIALQYLLSLLLKNAGGLQENTALVTLLSMAPMYLVGMPVCVRILKKLPKKNLYRNSVKPGRWFSFLSMCFFVMMAGNLIGNVVSFLITSLTGLDLSFDLQEILMSEGLGIGFLLTVILAPILEELVFRKALIDRAIVFGDRTAILLSGFIFGLFHGNFHQLFYAFGLGCMLAYLYIRTGEVKYTISVHMAINLIGGFLPTVLLKQMDLDFLSSGGMTSEMLEYVFSHLGIFALYLFYILGIFALAIVGLVFMILSVKKRVLRQGEYSMPAGQTAKAMFLNPGMLLFCVICVGLFVINIME